MNPLQPKLPSNTDGTSASRRLHHTNIKTSIMSSRLGRQKHTLMIPIGHRPSPTVFVRVMNSHKSFSRCLTGCRSCHKSYAVSRAQKVACCRLIAHHVSVYSSASRQPRYHIWWLPIPQHPSASQSPSWLDWA